MFYVYRLFDLTGETLYIGKGSGSRLSHQKRRYGLMGEIVKRFESENAAFAHERRLISKTKPRLNKCAGGNGGRAGARGEKPVSAWDVLWQILAMAIKRRRFLGQPVSLEMLTKTLYETIERAGLARVEEGLRPYGLVFRPL